MILLAFGVFATQLLFQLFRSLSTRTVAQGAVRQSVILSGIIQILWLLTTAAGVYAVIDGQILVVLAYIGGGCIGTYLNFKIGVK